MQSVGNFLSKQLSPPSSHLQSNRKEVNKKGAWVGAPRLFMTLIIRAPASLPPTPVPARLARTNDHLIVGFVGRGGRQAQFIVQQRLLRRCDSSLANTSLNRN